MFGRRKIAALAAEFLGTAALTLIVLSVQRSTIGVPFFIALAAGIAVITMTLVVGHASGGYFNPALTIAMWTARRLNTIKAVLFVAVQLLGGWAAYSLYKYLSSTPFQTINVDFSGKILTAEAIGTAVLAMGFAAAAYRKWSNGVVTAAAIVGLSLFLGILAASPASLGLLNPAVALGVQVWDWGTYVLGPIAGAIIGVNLYILLFADTEVLAGERNLLSLVKPRGRKDTAAPAVTAAPVKKPTVKAVAKAKAPVKAKAKKTTTRAKK